MILGIGLTVFGRLISSCQYIVEEQFVKKRNLPALVVVGIPLVVVDSTFLPHLEGMEGFFGFTIMSCIILPAIYFVPESNSSIVMSFRDDSIDALYQMRNNYIILIFVLLYVGMFSITWLSCCYLLFLKV
jgi:hypothetical protein